MKLNKYRAMCTVAAVGMACTTIMACGDEGDDVRDAAPRDGSPDSSDGPGGGDTAVVALTDAEIIHIMQTANKGEIDQGTLAQGKAQAPAVKDFAMSMITGHTMANTRLSALAAMAALTPAPNQTSKALQDQAAMDTQALMLATGAAFDALYMQKQEAMHAKVLKLLDEQLIPQAKNASLKAELTAARMHVAGHLAQAKTIKAALGNLDGGVTDGGVGDAAAKD